MKRNIHKCHMGTTRKNRKWEIELYTWGKVSNLWKSLMEQNNWRLTHDVMINKHIVNKIREPSFFPGPKICKLQFLIKIS